MSLIAAVAPATAQQNITMTLSKTHNAPFPIPSGQPFTYTIAYSWSGGAPGTITIRDTVPATLDVISTLPSASVSGNIVTFSLTGITASAGAGTVQINARFKPGVTCDGTRACNVAWVGYADKSNIASAASGCVTATATNKWTFEKSLIAGCALNSDVIFRVCIMNPSGGDIGGLNLTNVTLTDVVPTGAVVTAVSGSWSTFTQTGSNVTLGGGPSTLPVSPWNAWYCVYITVQFPSSSFAQGQTHVNSATASYTTPCDTAKPATFTDTAKVTLCAANPSGSLWKGLSINLYFPSNPWYYPSFSPGCCGTYTLAYTNNGNVSQPSFVMEDNVPSTLDVTSINTNVPAGNLPVTLQVYCWSGTSCSATPCTTVTYTTAGFQTLSSLPANVCKVRWSYSGSIGVSQSLYNYLNVCVRTASYAPPFTTVTSGQNILNTVTAQATNLALISATHTKPVDSLRPKILASKFFMGACNANTCSPNTAGPYVPGQIVRWRMAVANVGNVNASPATITDLLPSGLTYVGNPTYFYGAFNWMANQYNPPCCSLSTTVPSEIGGSITTPNPGDTNLTWSFSTLPFRCDGTVEYLVIEFDVKIGDAPPMPPGQYPNTFTFSAGNLPSPVTSNVAYVTVNAIAQLTLRKEVRPKILSGTFGPTATAPVGGQVEYRLRLQNTGNLGLTNICLLDIMPHVGDITVLPGYTPRNSMFDLPIGTGAVAAPGGYTVGYNTASNTRNPSRVGVCGGFCGSADPGVGVGVGAVTPGLWLPAAPSTFSFRASGGSTTLAPGGTLDVFVTATVPPGTQVGRTACNSFAVQATPVATTTCLKTEAVPACVTVTEKPVDVCDGLWLEPQLDSCCGYTVTLSNQFGAVQSLQYNVLPIGGNTPSGVVNSVQTSPCPPTSTVPASLSGTTSGTLNFNTSCTQGTPLNINLDASSTSTTGEICIELIVTVIRDGQKVECRDTVCFRCDPAPTTRCDSLSVKPFPFHDLDLSGRTFTIYNLKSPASPICSVKIAVVPPPSGPGVNGGGLYVDGIWKSWPFGSSNGYTEIKTVHGLPANNTVQFNLGIDYTIGWTGMVNITVYHCDGDSCAVRYGPWKATKKDVLLVGTPVDIPEKARLRAHRLRFGRDRAKDKDVRSFAFRYNDAVERILAVTGASPLCDSSGDCDDDIALVQVRDRTVFVELRRPLDQGDADRDITVLYTSAGARRPTVEILYFDADGNEVGRDTVEVVGNALNVEDDRAVTGALSTLSARPNPTSGRTEFGFSLAQPAVVDLELLDTRGLRVADLITGERMPAGEHRRAADLSSLPTGSYLLALRVDGVPAVIRVELVR